MSLPERTSDPGWPENLQDVDGYRYTRVRDGVSDPSGYGGHACQYIRQALDGYNHDHLYVPTLGSVEGDIRMSAGAYMTAEQCEKMGVPTVTLPPDALT